jgi:DNA mismatch repair ATPase MutS
LESNLAVENFYMLTQTKQGATDFDYTYKLKKGISELRGGLKILNDMDYPKEIMDKTREISRGT